MSYSDTFRKFLKEGTILEKDDYTELEPTEVEQGGMTDEPMTKDDDELDEESTSGGIGGYETPNAFGDLPNDKIEMLGYKKVAKKKLDTVKESTFKALAKSYYNL